jgi:hypothetical protein
VVGGGVDRGNRRRAEPKDGTLIAWGSGDTRSAKLLTTTVAEYTERQGTVTPRLERRIAAR